MIRFFITTFAITFTLALSLNWAQANIADKARDYVIDRNVKVATGTDLFSNDWLTISGDYRVGFKAHHNDIDKYYRYEELDFDALLRTSLSEHASVSFGPSANAAFIRPFFRRDLLQRKRMMVSLFLFTPLWQPLIRLKKPLRF